MEDRIPTHMPEALDAYRPEFLLSGSGQMLGSLALCQGVEALPVQRKAQPDYRPASGRALSDMRDFAIVMSEVALSLVFGDAEVPRSQLTSGSDRPDIIV